MNTIIVEERIEERTARRCWHACSVSNSPQITLESVFLKEQVTGADGVEKAEVEPAPRARAMARDASLVVLIMVVLLVAIG